MPNTLAEARAELALANRIVANEGVLDAFGHVSMRHPDNPNRYWLSRSRAPELVEPGGFIEYDLNSMPVAEPGVPQYSERVIHGEIYKARPDVMSVCHHHAPAFMPLLATGTDYMPVFHLGAVGGIKPPFWDQRDEFGDTNMLVVKPEEGASLARALGRHWMVLMRRHGVTVAGTGVRDCVFRTIYAARNAEYQVNAMAIGNTIASLSPGETEQAAADQRQDHRPHPLVGILVGTGGQGRRGAVRAAPERPNPRDLPQSRAAPRKRAGGANSGFPSGQGSVLNVAHGGRPQTKRNSGRNADMKHNLIRALGLIAPLALLAVPAQAEDTLKLAIGQINNWENQAPTLGQDAGIFKKHGLVLESVGTRGAGETIQAVISGSADIGAGVGAAGVMRAYSKGAPVRILAPMFTGTGDLYWYVKADSKIKTLKDATPENTIAYSTNGSSSNNIVVAFVDELGCKAKPTATGSPGATLTVDHVGPDRHRLGGAAVRVEGDQGRQDPHRRAWQRRALAARADRAHADRERRSAQDQARRHHALHARLSRSSRLDVFRSQGGRNVFSEDEIAGRTAQGIDG